MTAFVLITFDNPAHNRVSCHGDNKPQGWCTSLTFIARSQLHFHNNSISSFPGGLWLTAPEKLLIPSCFPSWKVQGSLLPSVEEKWRRENSSHGSTQQNPSALEWGEEGVRFCWAQAEPRARDWPQATQGGRAQLRYPPGRGRAGACHGASWLDAMWSWRGKNGSFVFSAQWLGFMASLCYSCSVGYGQIQDDNLYPKANWLWYDATPFRFA